MICQVVSHDVPLSDYLSNQASKIQGRRTVITWLLLLPWQKVEVLGISDLYHHLYRSRHKQNNKPWISQFRVSLQVQECGKASKNMRRESKKGDLSSLPSCWLLSWVLALPLAIYPNDQIRIWKQKNTQNQTKNTQPKTTHQKNPKKHQKNPNPTNTKHLPQ